jgi:hypothetical protein
LEVRGYSLDAAFDSQESVAWVFVYAETVRKIGAFWALILAEVVDALDFAAAKCDFL